MMPIHEYATSFGLAWKPSLSSRLTRAKEIDVSTAGINVLPADLRPHQVSTKEVLHPLAAAVCAALLLSSYLSLSVGYAEAGKVNTQLDHVNLQIQRVREQTASIKKVELEAEQLRKDFDALRTNAGFSAKLESLVQSVQPGMQLTTVSQVEGSITLSGTALTQDDIIAYVLRLQEQGSLSNPAISITASTSSGGPMMFKLLYSS
jgi:Tfp pilus assembly protein PilN